MALSISKTVCAINDALKNVFKGAVYYGIAKPLATEGRYRPHIEDKAISFDDDYAMKVYHKVTAGRISYIGGYGDNTDTINTFAMSAIVFNNQKKTKLRDDEIAVIIQSVLANITTTETITPTDFILNSEQVFSVEYRGHQYALPDNMSLMQFNYTVAITFKGGCFDICPEDFSHCKNN